MNNEVIIYQTAGHAIEVRLDDVHETLWLSQKQMSAIFSTSADNISLHFFSFPRSAW